VTSLIPLLATLSGFGTVALLTVSASPG